jgi:hypothetical protein
MKWPLTFYTNFGVPEGSAGATRGPVIFIRPEKRGDEGLYRHELVHVRQSLAGLLVVHALFYALVPPYRLWCEVQAYREQSRYYLEDRIPLFARFIAEKYRLNITAAEAEKLLRK